MARNWGWAFVVAMILVSSADMATAQQRRREDRDEQEEGPVLPTDRRLLAYHQQFIREVETLAMEYEREDEVDKAIDCYREILRLVPGYPPTERKLGELLRQQATAVRASFEVKADEGWQDTGIIVEQGKPIAIRVRGEWTFSLTAELGPLGMEIPEELRDYNLGCLLGVINTGNSADYDPFVVGEGLQLIAPRTGRLYMKMYDNDPSDNEGSLQVEFQGTFEQQ